MDVGSAIISKSKPPDFLGIYHDRPVPLHQVMVPMVLNAVTCIRDMPVSPVLYDPFAECRKQAEDWVPVPIGGFPSTNSLETVYRDGWVVLMANMLKRPSPHPYRSMLYTHT